MFGSAILTGSQQEGDRIRSSDLNRANLPIDIYRSYLGNVRIVDLEWQAACMLERSPIVADYTICVPISGTIEWQDTLCSDTAALVLDPSRPFPGIASTDGRVLLVGGDRATIEAVLAKLLDRAVKQPLSFEPIVDLDTEFGKSFKEFIEFLGRSRAPALNIASPLMQAELAGALLACLLKGVKHNYSDEILYHDRGAFACYVKQASSFIESHLQDEIGLADIAAAVNISPRLLQKAFAQEYDCSPMRFVTRSRLQRIRQELECASIDTRIVDVMMNYGITQGGKFAKEYQQLFGEKPSDTLKRACRIDRQNYPLWDEIDDVRSERIVGGVVREFCAYTFRVADRGLTPPLQGNPAIWGSYLRSIGICLGAQLCDFSGVGVASAKLNRSFDNTQLI